MSRFLNRIWILLIPVIVLSSCGKKKDAFRYMPAESQFVVSLNVGQMSEKMNFNAIRNETGLGMIGMMLSGQGIPNFINDRSVVGLNFEKPGYMYGFPQAGKGLQFAVLFPVEDAEKLETFLSKIDKSFKPEKEGGITGGELAFGQVGWTDKWMIATFSPSEMMPDEMRSVHDLFNLGGSASLSKSPQAEKMAASSKDIHLWVDLTKVDSMGEAHGIDLGNELALEGSIEFLDGEALMEITLHGDEATTDKWATLFGDGNAASLAKYLPKSGVQPAVLGVSLNPENMVTWMEESGIMASMVDEAESSHKALMQMVASQMSKALSGEILIAATKFPDEQPQIEDLIDSTAHHNPMPMCIGIGLADKAAFEQFVQTQVADSHLVALADGSYLFPNSHDSARLVLTTDAAYISSQANVIANIQRGSETGGLDAETISNMGEHVLYGRLDVQGYFEAMTEMADGSEGMLGMISGLASAMSGAIDYAEWIANKPTKDGWKHTFRAKMTKDSPNSLELITRQIVDGILGSGLFQMM